MPELPDVTVYLESLERHVVGQPLEKTRIASPFLLRSVEPPVSACEGQPVTGVRRLGKRIVFAFPDELFMLLHLMIAGRLRWKKRGFKPPRKVGLAAFDFPNGTLSLTEMGSRKRASLHVVLGETALAAHDPGGIDVMGSTVPGFAEALRRDNHTLKRALTDPRILSGIGNAYSDEILHAARLSPFKQTSKLTDDEFARLHAATLATLRRWTDELRAEVGDGFPDKVTAFRDGMAVHGRYKEPCPACGDPVQRIVYASNETNYCATCQTDGKLLADRVLSQLLKKDWPKTLEELENRRGRQGAGD
ncbi:MAG: Fpg/Nei family DNA glycosylase [Planctomycetota bacterium]